MKARSKVRSDAEEHIAQIRHSKGLSEDSSSGHNVTDLESALTTLSEQLYQSSTRFLLELLQNADDNSYDSKVEPSVEFTYAKECLRVDCNEVGFSARNVEALCRVGQSTKKDGDNARMYVGEKGIGFKSVFKAADIVWVSSGEYSFKFDKSKQLGMIAPIWDDFPAPIKPGFTSFYLQLSETYNQRGLVDELLSLDSRLLIFLRRLQNITVSISEPGSKPWKSSFSRSEIGKDLIRLVENDKICDYIVTRHQVSSMPLEPKRQGASSSEIILGFPITDDHGPKRESQHAYAFLPIRDYGFEFLIQADFLLTASREDIDESSEWNAALRDALSTAFVDTMKGFNQLKLRYVWPRYLPNRDPLHSFLKPFHLDLIDKLSSQSVIFSQSGDLIPPKCLTYVPETFAFDGTPLTLSSRNSRRYLSAYYSKSDVEYLKVLGVVEMSEITFLAELITLLRTAKAEFTSKSNAWHSNLARTLISLPQHLSPQLLTLEIVPLSDGSWVAAQGHQILFPAQKTDFELPGGLKLAVVHSDAATDPERRKLLKILGVGDHEEEPIVRHIVDLHKNVPASSISRAALISQVKFLYSTGWKNTESQSFWFTSEHGKRLEGRQLYQDSSNPYSATWFFRGHRNKFHFIDKDYNSAAANNRDTLDSWDRWLEEKMEVATIPRLVQFTPNGFKLSEDFEFIIKNFPSSDILLLIRDNWKEYSQFLGVDQRKNCEKEDRIFGYDSVTFITCATRLRERLGSMLVTCTTGKTHRLDKTFLPRKELLVASQNDVLFLDVPDAENPNWLVLETFGVSSKVDVSFYLRSLETLTGSDDGSQVTRLLDLIQFRCHDGSEASIAKNFFGIKNMVYIPANKQQSQLHEWKSLSQCRWKGPQGLRTFASLKDIYPEHKRLFCGILGVQDTTIQDLVTETKSFSIGDSLNHITGIFHTMEMLLEEENNAKSIKIDFCKLPVSKNWKQDKDRVLNLQSSANRSEWFIADTAPFRTTFAGVVPLLDIQVEELAAMHQILVKLGLSSRFLSRNARSVGRTGGAVEYSQELTNSFRKKVDFIIRLIPTSKLYRKKREIVIQQLRNVQVYTADEVIQEWCVSYKGKTVKGPPGNGRVALVAENDGLKIYLAAKGDFGEELAPIELVDEIFNFCGMSTREPRHSEMCLHVALSQSNPARISKLFTDKGIPSLESLKFADASESTSEDDDECPLASKGQDSALNGPKKSRTFRRSSIAGAKAGVAVLAFPVVGLCALFKRKKLFDGDDTWQNAKPLKKKPTVPPVPAARTSSKAQHVRIKAQHQSRISTNWFRPFLSDENIAFMGEFALHQALAETLGHHYNPLHHWTSSHRAKANIAKFYPKDAEQHSSFEFSDIDGAFSQLLSEKFPAAKNWLATPPTYHIDVKSTRGNLGAQFSISPAQFRRARDLSFMMQRMKGDLLKSVVGTQPNGIPTDVYILVRVYNVDSMMAEDPKGKGKERSNMLFVVDPWDSYLEDSLTLKPTGQFVGSIVDPSTHY